MSERIQTALLPMAELFGTRNQDYSLESAIVPTYDTRQDVLANGRVVGADSAVTGVIAPNVRVNTSVRVTEDTYFTGAWLLEPNATTLDGLVAEEIFWQRNRGGAFVQLAALSIPTQSQLCGGTGNYRRTLRLIGIDPGTLLLAGDIISCTIYNNTAGATSSGFLLAYRGLSGPPG